jgi:hypothetical protein
MVLGWFHRGRRRDGVEAGHSGTGWRQRSISLIALERGFVVIIMVLQSLFLVGFRRRATHSGPFIRRGSRFITLMIANRR